MLTGDSNIPSLSKDTPRITGNDIPEDVWRLIVEQVALMTDVFPLMGLNHAFFEYALARRYREVQWFTLSASFLKKLERLQVPIVAQSVRVLHIRAWFIEYLLQRDALFHRPTSLSKFKGVLLAPFSFASLKINGNNRKTPEPQSMLKHQAMLQNRHRQDIQDTSCTKVISSMITAVEGMRNVVQLNFEWRDLPVNPDTRQFLTSTRTSLDESLRKLTLRAQISNFKELLAVANFGNLDELNFHFDYKVKGASNSETIASEDIPDPEVQESLETVIPFIERRQSSLRSLFISSTSSMDLAPFLKALSSNTPSLRSFGLQIFYDEVTLSDPSAFLHVLISSSLTLRHISLLANAEQAHIEAGRKQIPRLYPEQSNMSLRRSQWNRVNELLLSKHRCLTNLQTLEIPFVSLQKTMPILQRSSDTLTRLRLVDHYLNTEEVTEILGLFNHRPLEVEHLHIEVLLLDMSLLELLSTRLPDLSSLVLVYRSINTLEFTSFGDHTPAASLFNWKLHECEVFEHHYNPLHYSKDGSLMLTLLRLIPSLHTLNGIPRRN